jgi:hypothetical protein
VDAHGIEPVDFIDGHEQLVASLILVQPNEGELQSVISRMKV